MHYVALTITEAVKSIKLSRIIIKLFNSILNIQQPMVIEPYSLTV